MTRRVRYRLVAPTEAEAIAPALASLHEDAFRADMALGSLESIGRDGLESAYRDAVAALDDGDRGLLVAEEDGEILAMAQLTRSRASEREPSRSARLRETRGDARLLPPPRRHPLARRVLLQELR